MNLSVDVEQEIENIVHKSMQAWSVLRLAIVVVKDDQVLFAKGYGVRESGRPERVDEHTIFDVGSLTKAFTAISMGLLVQDGKINWDDRVTQYIPDFQLFDPNATQLITIRDLLSNRSGLGTWAGDLLLMSKFSTEEIVQRIRHIPPEFDFRAGFGYSNLMFITAGLIISRVSGMSWDEFVHQQIFEPVGMTDSVADLRYLGEHTNTAKPHLGANGQRKPMDHPKDWRAGPSGSICSSAADIALWMRLQLNQGSLDGKQVVEPVILAETHMPHTFMKLKAAQRKLFPSRHFSAYGLGWMLSDTYGRLNLHHTGDVYGMLSNMVLIPEEKLGIAVLTNKYPGAAHIVLSHHLSQRLTGAVPQDWVQIYIDLEKGMKEREKQAIKQKASARAKDIHPSLALAEYAGNYESPILGEATISVERDALHIQLQSIPSLSGRLEHWEGDTFLCKWDDPMFGESLVLFDMNSQVIGFRVKVREDWIDPLEYVFKRK